MPSFDGNNPFADADPTGGSNDAFDGTYPPNFGTSEFGVNSGYDAEGNVGQIPMDFGPIDPQIAHSPSNPLEQLPLQQEQTQMAQGLVPQANHPAATQQNLTSLNAEGEHMEEDSDEHSDPREPVIVPRYPPVAHVPTGIASVRSSALHPETRVDPATIPTFTNGSGNNQNGNTSENPGTEAQTSDPDQAIDSDGDKINWIDEHRFDLLLQIAYERRHESLSEAAWKRIANASHGGPFENASWNGVRLEFARLMRERFPGYGNETVEARERGENLDRIATAQENGAPSTVPASAIAHHVSDADNEQRERLQARQSRRGRGRARGTTTNSRGNGTRARGGQGRGRQQRVNGHAG